MQYRPLPVDDQGMPRVVSALEANHSVDALGEQVHDGALALIAPLRTDYDDVATHAQPRTR